MLPNCFHLMESWLWIFHSVKHHVALMKRLNNRRQKKDVILCVEKLWCVREMKWLNEMTEMWGHVWGFTSHLRTFVDLYFCIFLPAVKQQITVCVTKFTTNLNVFVPTWVFFCLSASSWPRFFICCHIQINTNKLLTQSVQRNRELWEKRLIGKKNIQIIRIKQREIVSMRNESPLLADRNLHLLFQRQTFEDGTVTEFWRMKVSVWRSSPWRTRSFWAFLSSRSTTICSCLELMVFTVQIPQFVICLVSNVAVVMWDPSAELMNCPESTMSSVVTWTRVYKQWCVSDVQQQTGCTPPSLC